MPLKQSLSVSQVLSTAVTFGVFFYLAYHLMHGDRGYFAWKGLEQKLAVAQADYDQTLANRAALEQQVKMLRPGSLDLDMLDERARIVLGFTQPDEKVIPLNN